MGYKPLNRPNNFMLGSKPWYPAIYDENITPLEQMNKLAEKLNEIIGDDTNVKNDVEKLLGVWKDVFMAKAGYVPAIETIYSENNLIINVDSPDLIDMKYINRRNRYKPVKLNCTGNFTYLVYQYYNGTKYVTFSESKSDGNDSINIYLNTNSETFSYRIIGQNKNYTNYFYMSISIVDIIEPQDINIVTDFTSNINDFIANLFNNHYLYPSQSNDMITVEWFFSYNYGMGDEITKIGEGNIDNLKLINLKVSHEIYTFDGWVNEVQNSARENNGVFNNLACQLNQYRLSTSCEIKIIMKCTLGSKVATKELIIKKYNESAIIPLSNLEFPDYTLRAYNSTDSYDFGRSIAGNAEEFTRYHLPTEFNLDYTSAQKAHLFYFSLEKPLKKLISELDTTSETKTILINYSEKNINPSVYIYSRLTYSSMIGDWLRFDYNFLYIFYNNA